MFLKLARDPVSLVRHPGIPGVHCLGSLMVPVSHLDLLVVAQDSSFPSGFGLPQIAPVGRWTAIPHSNDTGASSSVRVPSRFLVASCS